MPYGSYQSAAGPLQQWMKRSNPMAFSSPQMNGMGSYMNPNVPRVREGEPGGPNRPSYYPRQRVPPNRGPVPPVDPGRSYGGGASPYFPFGMGQIPGPFPIPPRDFSPAPEQPIPDGSYGGTKPSWSVVTPGPTPGGQYNLPKIPPPPRPDLGYGMPPTTDLMSNPLMRLLLGMNF